MRKSIYKPVFALFTLAVLFSQQLQAKLIFTAPPRESRQSALELYTPFAKHLSELLGEEVEYQYPRGWLRYQRDIRRNIYDLIFDGPHFASWRMAHLGHKPLVKLPGTLVFYFITPATNVDITKSTDLIYKKVCIIPPPNLTALVLLSELNDPIKEPVLKSVKGGMKAVFKELDKNSCVAAVVRSNYYDKRLSDEQRAKYKIIHTTKPIPNQVITASTKVDKTSRDKIIQSLTEGPGVEVANKIVKRFGGKKVKSFIKADKADYEGQNKLLEGVILGW